MYELFAFTLVSGQRSTFFSPPEIEGDYFVGCTQSYEKIVTREEALREFKRVGVYIESVWYRQLSEPWNPVHIFLVTTYR